jgi:hypothetical protein
MDWHLIHGLILFVALFLSLAFLGMGIAQYSRAVVSRKARILIQLSFGAYLLQFAVPLSVLILGRGIDSSLGSTVLGAALTTNFLLLPVGIFSGFFSRTAAGRRAATADIFMFIAILATAFSC